MIRVFYIEDHPVTVSGMRSQFRPGRSEVKLVGSAFSVIEAAAKIQPDDFDILLLDFWLDASDPLKNVEEALLTFPDKPVVIFSGEQRINYIRKAFELGVHAFISKSCKKETLEITLKDVMNGNKIIPDILKLSDSKQGGGLLPGQFINLSEKQLKILALLQQGVSNKTIGSDYLQVSESSVDKALVVLRSIFNANTNAELIAKFLKSKSK